MNKKVTVTLAKASDPNDDDLTIEIEAGTTLVAAINDIYKYIFEEADGLQERLNTLTGNGEVQGSINDAIANAFLDRFANGTLYTQAQCDEKSPRQMKLSGQDVLVGQLHQYKER